MKTYIEGRTYFAVVYVDERVEHNETDLCLRWLASRRDYPYYRCTPPQVSDRVMRRCVEEFCRSNPGFTL